MIRLHIILLLFFVGSLCNAQSIEKRYSSHLSNAGVINFFHPQKLKKNTNLDMFAFDMTYISYNDSITVNCSYRIQTGSNIKSLKIKSDNDNMQGNDLSVLYREVQKHGYEVRVTSRFSFSDIKNAFSNSAPLVFEIVTNDGSCHTASYRKSAWEKESMNVTRILESINY